MPGEGSFLARCALKFSEVLAAGVATGLSGYVVAHLAGYVAGPMFSVTQPAPNQGAVRPAVNVGGATAPLPKAASTNDSAPQRPSKPEVKLFEPVPEAPARPKISPTKSKPVETRAAETVPGGAAARRPQDAAGRKPDHAESLEARVRAALARSNGRTALTEVRRRQLQTPSAVPYAVPSVAPRPPAAAVAAAPAEATPAPAASASRDAALLPQRIDIAPQPAEAQTPPIPPNLVTHATQMSGQTPGGQNPTGQNSQGQNSGGPISGVPNSAIELPPLATVVVKSQPSGGTDSPQPTPAAADAQPPHESQGSGPFSAFARMLRSDKPLPENQAPRPPIAVGQ